MPFAVLYLLTFGCSNLATKTIDGSEKSIIGKWAVVEQQITPSTDDQGVLSKTQTVKAANWGDRNNTSPPVLNYLPSGVYRTAYMDFNTMDSVIIDGGYIQSGDKMTAWTKPTRIDSVNYSLEFSGMDTLKMKAWIDADLDRKPDDLLLMILKRTN
jgi:hypothetical protein